MFDSLVLPDWAVGSFDLTGDGLDRVYLMKAAQLFIHAPWSALTTVGRAAVLPPPRGTDPLAATTALSGPCSVHRLDDTMTPWRTAGPTEQPLRAQRWIGHL